MKLQIKQDGNVKTFIRYMGIIHTPDNRTLHIRYGLSDENPGLPVLEVEQKPMLVDNLTPVPVVDQNGDPVMITTQQPTGNYVMINVGDPIGQDQEGNPIYDQVPDYSQPIMQNVDVQKTIGEYDAVMWWFWDHRNPTPHSSIEQMIQEGMLRRLGMSQTPYVFTETAEWLATQTGSVQP